MLRYYPPSKVTTNLNTSGGEFVDSSGKPYTGKYYITFDGRYFTGAYPEEGKNEPLKRAPAKDYSETSHGRGVVSIGYEAAGGLPETRVVFAKTKGAPTSHQPQPLESDYRKGYFNRYFTKKENENGYITEISQQEYNAITNGTVTDYDISIYQVTKILWKLTGPLKSQRKSQYNVIPGIIDTNQRLTETSNKTFLGIVDFIGGEYDKFARPTP